MEPLPVQPSCCNSSGHDTSDGKDDDGSSSSSSDSDLNFKRFDAIGKTMEDLSTDEEKDSALEDQGCVAGALSKETPSIPKGQRFSWPFPVRAGETHPFLNDRNTADLVFCETLLALQPWKGQHGHMSKVHKDFMDACRTSPDRHGEYPLKHIKQWVTARSRMKEYEMVWPYLQDKTGPRTGDVLLDGVLQADDGVSETTCVAVLLWRALRQVLDAKQTYMSEKENAANIQAKNKAQDNYLRDAAVGLLDTRTAPDSTRKSKLSVKGQEAASVSPNHHPAGSLSSFVQADVEVDDSVETKGRRKRAPMKRKDDDGDHLEKSVELLASHAADKKKKEEARQALKLRALENEAAKLEHEKAKLELDQQKFEFEKRKEESLRQLLERQEMERQQERQRDQQQQQAMLELLASLVQKQQNNPN